MDCTTSEAMGVFELSNAFSFVQFEKWTGGGANPLRFNRLARRAEISKEGVGRGGVRQFDPTCRARVEGMRKQLSGGTGGVACCRGRSAKRP